MNKRIQKRNISSQMTPGVIPDMSSLISLPSDSEQFFQFEPAVVLDAILDETHPEIKGSVISKNLTPPKMDGSDHDKEKDLSLIGHIRARLLYSEKGASILSTRHIVPSAANVSYSGLRTSDSVVKRPFSTFNVAPHLIGQP